MDRLLEQSNRACVRDVMMRQEEIFKQQVHDLHRLYQVQKVLMAEQRTDTENKYGSSTSKYETGHSSFIMNNQHHHKKMAEEPSVRHKGFDLEQLVEEGASTSRMQSKEFWADGECEVELTLSIGCSTSKKKPRNWHPSETRQPLFSSNGARQETSEECRERESLQRPPWLYQALSLNRT